MTATKDEIETYFETLLSAAGDYQLTPKEEKIVARDKAEFIMDKLMRKKFRRRVGDDVRKTIAEKVAACLQSGEPIHLVIPFGSYKHFWNSSHPEPDWAEVTHFLWMTEYVSPILAVHEAGVVLEYVSEDLILPLMNNYPESALETYAAKFRELIEWYRKYIPDNLQIDFWRVGDKYDAQAIINKVEALLPERRAVFAKLSAEAQEQELHRSTRSVLWQGKDDLTNLSDEQKRQRTVDSRLIELAYYDIEASPEFLGEYFWQGSRICICFSFGLSPDNDEFGDLTIATSLGSIVDFWIGRGVLKQHDGKFYGSIISKNQYENSAANTTTVKVDTKLKTISKNYENIEIFVLQ
jgi:hypothetical protein